MDKEHDIVTPDKKTLTIGKIEIDITRITAERTLKAAKTYNEWASVQYKDDYTAVLKLLDTVFTLIQIDFTWTKSIDWMRRLLITKKTILKNLDYRELSTFVEEALDPILGDKKREMERLQTLEDLGVEMAGKLGPERYAELLQNLPSLLAGLGEKS